MKIQHKERPILFSGPMVRAIREGRKTQTRRVVSHPLALHAKLILGPHDGEWWDCVQQDDTGGQILCPYGQPGDRLWVRETFRLFDSSVECACYDDCRCASNNGKPVYRADFVSIGEKWRPAIHMPRWASRITLEIVSVRVEMLQDISDEDAKAEGCEMEDAGFPKPQPDASGIGHVGWCTAIEWYQWVWESINGPGSWDLNPWVWVVEFKEFKT